MLAQSTAARVDSTFWLDAQQYAQIYAVQPLPDSSSLVLGSQWYADGSLASNLVRLLPDGLPDQAFQQQLGGLELGQASYGQLMPRLLRYPDGRILVIAPDRVKLVSYPQLNGPVVRLLPDGQPDPGFVMNLGGSRMPNLRAAALQPDGKILLAGDGGTTGPRLIRLNANGSLDTGFNPLIGTARATDAVNAVAVQPDGRILVGGFFSAPGNALIRLLINGQPDASFQAGVAGGADVQEVLLRPGGQILVVARSSVVIQGHTAGIQQLLASGQRDVSFQAPPAYGVIAQPNGQRAHLLPDGRLLVLPAQPVANAAPIRLLANGQQDVTFMPTGRLPLVMQGSGLDAAGNMLIYGQYNHKAGLLGSLQRLLPSGQVDAQYRPQLYRPGYIRRMLRLADGRTLLVGRFDVLGNVRAGNVACLLANDELDTAFTRRSPFVDGPVERIAVQPSGRILLGGGLVVQARQTWNSLVRIHSDGRLDTTFQRVVVSGYALQALAVQGDGRIVIGGILATAYNGRWFARLGVNGALDNTFLISLTLDSWLRGGNQVAVQPDGRLLLAGQQIHRVLPSGQYDPTYQATEVNAHRSLLLQDMVLQTDGKLALCGQVPTSALGQRGTIARLLATGRLDTTFRDHLSAQFDARNLLPRAGGGLWVGGYSRSAVTAGLGVVRVNPDGSLDALLPVIPGYGSVYACSETSGNRMLLGGEFVYAPNATRQQLGLLRLTNAGTALPVAQKRKWRVLQVYPNPARHAATLTGTTPGTVVQVLDALGRVVTSAPADATGTAALRLPAGLAAGVYVVRAGTAAARLVIE
ncbi:hypothetical protein GCM10022406_31020 [Hymenobacter algoricola]|uniref:T9SS type A sorting domain-containing protein n=1 Tax=Hymenobacter algoricola TaxID=486267 RepID=A0ABP7NH85_9BACT